MFLNESTTRIYRFWSDVYKRFSAIKTQQKDFFSIAVFLFNQACRRDFRQQVSSNTSKGFPFHILSFLETEYQDETDNSCLTSLKTIILFIQLRNCFFQLLWDILCSFRAFKLHDPISASKPRKSLSPNLNKDSNVEMRSDFPNLLGRVKRNLSFFEDKSKIKRVLST